MCQENGAIEQFFFEEDGNTVTANSKRCIKMTLEPTSRRQDANKQRVLFQQDGATPRNSQLDDS